MNILHRSPPTFQEQIWHTLRSPFDGLKQTMDALLSLPVLSFLVIPTFSSYSTSLNLLFFYLTWSTLILSHSPLRVEIIGTLAVRLLFFVLPSLAFLAFDAALPALARAVKEHGDEALPLRQGEARKWWRIAGVSVGNVLLGVAVQAGVEVLFTDVFHVRSALKVTTGIPMPWGIFKDLLRGLLLREVLTYVLHRYALHSPSSSLRDMHHRWQHSVSPPYALVANYDHPLPYLVHVFLPAFIPAVLFRFHLLTYHIYLAFVSLEETFAYSGYNVLPSGFILGGIARRQERHLIGDGTGNYGCLGLVDLILGTSLGDDVLDDVREETDKQQVGERVKAKVRASGRRAKK